MPRMTKEQVEASITKAVVHVATSKGVGATGMADVARTARVSAGTLYLHFENKEDMLQKTYIRIKTDFHARLMRAAAAGTSAAIIRSLWDELMLFLKEQPGAFLFLEYAGAAQILNQDQRKQMGALQQEVNALLQTAIEDGTLAYMPLGVAINLIIGPAMHLARTHALAGVKPDDDTIEQTFARVWASLRAA